MSAEGGAEEVGFLGLFVAKCFGFGEGEGGFEGGVEAGEIGGGCCGRM